jgi:5-hydroxyisourate hydrolase
MPGKLSTHVLDLTAGRPAAGMKIELWRDGERRELLKSVETNGDGRTDAPLLEAPAASGSYELLFFVRDYFAGRGVDCPFLDRVPVRFTMPESEAGCHVPLLVSPWAYNTYRGS